MKKNSKVRKMPLEEIFNYTGVIMKERDIRYFCEDSNIIAEFIELNEIKELDNNEIKEFLLKNEEAINKEKLILSFVITYTENIRTIIEVLKIDEVNHDSNLSNKKKLSISEKIKLEKQKEIQENNLKNAMRLGKGIEQVMPIYYYNSSSKKYEAMFKDSREIIDGVKRDKKSKLKMLNKIDIDFKSFDREGKIGIEYLLQSIVLTDFGEIFSDKLLGDVIRTMILDNLVLRKQIKTREELEELRKKDNHEYESLVKEGDFSGVLPDIKNVVEEYIEYIDIEKLIMICAYRLEESLEDNKRKMTIENVHEIKMLLEKALEHCKEKNKKYNFRLQKRKNFGYEYQDIEFSKEDIKKCIKRIVDDKYITKSEINELKEKVNLGEIKLKDLELKDISIIFSPEELEKNSMLSDDNLMYVAKELKWDKDKILQKIKEKRGCSTEIINYLISTKNILADEIVELYMSDFIDINQINDIKDNIDLSEKINSYELIKYYVNGKEKDVNKEEEKQFNKYLKLYKEILIKDTSEKIKNYEDKLMEAMIDNYEENRKKQYIDQLEVFCKEGLLTLDTILEWNDESVVK